MTRAWRLCSSLLFNICFIALTAYYSLRAFIWLHTGRADRLALFGRLWAGAVVRCLRRVVGIRVRIEGVEHLPLDAPFLIASTHQSAFDTVIWMLLPRPSYVLKKELLKIPLFGACLEPGGMIPVDRKAGARAIRDLIRRGEAARAAGRQVVIFPQGTRAAPGEARIIQPGVAALAGAMAVPVFPVVTNSGAHWGRNAFRKFPGTIRIRIGRALPSGLPRAAFVQALDAAWGQLEDEMATPVDNIVGEDAESLDSRTKKISYR
ncbi:lysophospholipid acyltransferase family protein [Acidisoma sp. C75]